MIMKKYLSMLSILLLLGAAKAEAQYGGARIFVGPGYARPYNPQRRHAQNDGFKPFVTINVGYGFPNLDKNQFLPFTNAYMGNISQTGPISGSIDYQFSRFTSIGIMATYGKVTVPYYDASSNAQAFSGSLEDVSIMLNLVNYFPTNNKYVSPYLRTAIGVNSWSQNYTYSDGSNVSQVQTPSEFAYQVSLGVKFRMTNNTGLFVEAGYGKYILAAGLSFKL